MYGRSEMVSGNWQLRDTYNNYLIFIMFVNILFLILFSVIYDTHGHNKLFICL